MPRLTGKRKAESTDVHNNNNSEFDAPKSKLIRSFQLPLPKRPCVVGMALVCGQGDMGQLGLGDHYSNLERKKPTLVEKINNVVDVKAGGMHSLVMTLEGQVYSFGCNDEGALGRDHTENVSEFEPGLVDLPGKALKISAGDSHSACLLEDGRVFAWGSFRDSHGNMGLTLAGNKRLPIDILPGVICCDIASGADHLVILTCRGKVYTVGCAEQGQLGRICLRSVSGEGRRGKSDLLRPGLVIVKRAKPIEAIWATNYCTFLRESQTGIIWAFGLNNYKQLAYVKDKPTITIPITTKFENVKQIAGGQHHTIILKDDGSVYVIGRKDYGRLGLGLIQEDATELQPITALKDKNIVSVYCGEAQSFALTDDGKLYSWGMGSNYQLGTGSEDDGLEPLLVVSKQIEGKSFITVSSGGQHSIFLVEGKGHAGGVDTKKKQKPATKSKAKLTEKSPTENLTEEMDGITTINGDETFKDSKRSNVTYDDKKDEDGLDPVLVVSNQIEDKHFITASNGCQHSIFLEDKYHAGGVDTKKKQKPAAETKGKLTEEVPTENLRKNKNEEMKDAHAFTKTKGTTAMNGDETFKDSKKSDVTHDDKKEEDSKVAVQSLDKRGPKKK